MHNKFTSAVKKVIKENHVLEEMQQKVQNSDVHEFQTPMFDQNEGDVKELEYLDVFISLTEQCLNNPNKSATMSTDLIILISQLLSSPSKWKSNFYSDIQYKKNIIMEKINQFLQNSVLIVENQKPVQKIMIMALTNLTNITEPEGESFCEFCMKTLKDLYLNNLDLRKLLQQSIKKNVISSLDQDSYDDVPLCLIKGLVNFANEIEIGGWFTERQSSRLGKWLEQIFTRFEKQNIEQAEQQMIDSALQLISRCFNDQSFSTLISIFITTKGVQSILNECIIDDKVQSKSTFKIKPDEALQKNRIVLFIFEIVCKIPNFVKRSKPDELAKYKKTLEGEIKVMNNELTSKCKYNFGLSDHVLTPEHCQIMNRKLGAMIKAYCKIIVEQNDPTFKDSHVCNAVLHLICYKKVDPYIYGCCILFLNALLESKSILTSENNLRYIFQASESFMPLVQQLLPANYNELLNLAKVYGSIQVPDVFTLNYMPTKELQYCIIQILECFKTIRLLSQDSSHPFRAYFQQRQEQLEQHNYKNTILQCIESPKEELRSVVAFLLTKIDFAKWDLDDIKVMFKVLDKLQYLLQDSMGEEEISTLLMIFCKIISNKSSQVTQQFVDNPTAGLVARVAHQILKINMARDTSNDPIQTKQKIELSASCVFLLTQFNFSIKLRPSIVHYDSQRNLAASLCYQDQFQIDGLSPLCIEQVILVIQPLFQAIESDTPVNPSHLNFFTILMQICNILNFTAYLQITENQDGNAEELESPADILQNYRTLVYHQCIEQWSMWQVQLVDVDSYQGIDDLSSSFEVQHTIFSSQNGLDRLLICLKSITDSAVCNIDEVPIPFESLEQLVQKNNESKFTGQLISKHALHSKLLGSRLQRFQDSKQFQSQFFETIQKKKTLANSMVDITLFNKEDDFYGFMLDQQLSQKTKIALITSAFLYSCYISIVFAPQNDPTLLKNALGEIQQKYKLIGYIKLCAASEWYNASVSQKLFKIQRLIYKHIFQYNNYKQMADHEVLVLEQDLKQLRNQDLTINDDKIQIKRKQILEAKSRTQQNLLNYYQCPLSLSEQLDNCYVLFQTIEIILSDFKEIIECIDQEQLIKQLRLVNSIFKTIQMILKQFFVFAAQQDSSERFNEVIISNLVSISSMTVKFTFFQELIACITKMDKKLSTITDIYLQKIDFNLSQALGQYYTVKGNDLKDIFACISRNFSSARLTNIVNCSIAAWLASTAFIQFNSSIHPDAPILYKQVHLFDVPVDFKSDDQQQYKKCHLLCYSAMFCLIELVNIKPTMDFIQHELSSANIKVIELIQGQQIKDSYTKDMNTEYGDEGEVEEGSIEIRGLELLLYNPNTEKKDIVYSMYFSSGYLCKKVNKLFGKYIQSQLI